MDRVASPSETLRHLTALPDLILARPEHGAGALADVHGRPRSYTDDTSNDINDDTGEGVVGRVLDGLALLRELRTELAGWEPELIAAARDAGASWAQLAPALGVASRQAAERRYLRLQPTGGTETTKEARVAATRERRAGDRAVTAWARQNSAKLRQLAGQVSTVGGSARPGNARPTGSTPNWPAMTPRPCSAR